MTEPPDFSIVKLIAGFFGSLVSLKFVPGTFLEKALMLAGGVALSYFATSPVTDWLAIPKTEGLIGFFIGLFGMALVSKVYEVLLLLDAAAIAADLWAAFKRKLGA